MNIDIKHLENDQIITALANHTCRDILHTFRGIMICSLYDPTIMIAKKASINKESDIVKSINRKTGLQFQSISEIAQHADKLEQKKLLTD